MAKFKLNQKLKGIDNKKLVITELPSNNKLLYNSHYNYYKYIIPESGVEYALGEPEMEDGRFTPISREEELEESLKKICVEAGSAGSHATNPEKYQDFY